jgi:hypothetical protein
MARNVEDVGTHERLPAGDYEQTTLVDLGDLIDEPEAFLRGEFVVSPAGFGRGVEVAMVALEIAAFGEIQRNKIGLEVVDGSAVIGGLAGPGGREKLRDLLLKYPERA